MDLRAALTPHRPGSRRCSGESPALPSCRSATCGRPGPRPGGVPPPKGARRRLLMLGIAWTWQAEMHGGLSRQLERRLAALDAPHRQSGAVGVSAAKRAGARRLMPGTRLMRVWGDTRHEVVVTETGFLWLGRSWTSLSAIARAITGTRRNGPAFFGVRYGGGA
jgi:Protein of unknown function (DUF2924)